MIKDGGSHSASKDREYPDHSHIPIPKYLLSPETREEMRRRREKAKEEVQARKKAKVLAEAQEWVRAEEQKTKEEAQEREFRRAVEEMCRMNQRTVPGGHPRDTVPDYVPKVASIPMSPNKVFSGRYDLDTEEVVTDGAITGHQVMFTMKFTDFDPQTLMQSGTMTVFGKKGVQKASFSTNDPRGFPKVLGDYIEENREKLGV